jgi:hypothetical protein
MSWTINKNKALEKFLTQYREERDKKFIELDVEFMKALETNDTSEQSSIASEKNTLRDFPTTITTGSFSTVDELRATWPTGSLNLPDFWI